jgi:hypothetical protein
MYIPLYLLKLASQLDCEARMTTDPIIQEDLITRAAMLRSFYNARKNDYRIAFMDRRM